MARKSLRIGRLTTDRLVAEMKGEGSFIHDLVKDIAQRDDCTIYHLLDLADTPVITVLLAEPGKDYARLWEEDDVIETKLKSLTLKEQIAAAYYVVKKYSAGDAKESLKTFLLCMKVPEDSPCARLLSIVKDKNLSVDQHVSFLRAFELLAEKEGLLA